MSCIALFNLAAVCLHLWGMVQIDFALRENDRLTEKANQLRTDIDGFTVRLHQLRCYNRITALAKEQGLVFVPAGQRRDLAVDLEDVDRSQEPPHPGSAMAGLSAQTPRLADGRGGIHDP